MKIMRGVLSTSLPHAIISGHSLLATMAKHFTKTLTKCIKSTMLILSGNRLTSLIIEHSVFEQ